MARKKTFLCYDGTTLVSDDHLMYQISLWAGFKRLLQPWKYHLHHTMGRPIIVLNKVWGSNHEQ